MNNDFDFDFDDADDYVRPPDKPIREVLNGSVSNFNSNVNYNRIFEDELQQCLLESVLEQEQKQLEEEVRQIEQIDKMYKERKLICENVRKKLEKVKSYDINNKEFYETILSIIEMWELCQLEYFETDVDSYAAIHKIITSIRLTIDEHKFLDDLIRVNR